MPLSCPDGWLNRLVEKFLIFDLDRLMDCYG